jgi:hypothetical protein
MKEKGSGFVNEHEVLHEVKQELIDYEEDLGKESLFKYRYRYLKKQLKQKKCMGTRYTILCCGSEFIFFRFTIFFRIRILRLIF